MRLLNVGQVRNPDGLDAIVKATEAATNSIMECAEAVMAADARDPRSPHG